MRHGSRIANLLGETTMKPPHMPQAMAHDNWDFPQPQLTDLMTSNPTYFGAFL